MSGMVQPKFVLLSSSPRRAELLRRYGYEFQIVRPQVGEIILLQDVEPHQIAMLNAIRKFRSVKFDGVGLAADTVVVLSNRVLGKPSDLDEARRFLQLLSGKEHLVITAVVIGPAGDPSPTKLLETTKVKFMELGDFEIDYLLQADNPLDKAGGYAIQGAAGLFIERIEGDYTNVIGLPMPSVYLSLKHYGIRPKILNSASLEDS